MVLKKRFLKYLILLSTAYAMFRMYHWTAGFTFFTQLSNLYVAAAVLWQLIKPGRTASLLKYTSAVSIEITFLVYLFVIAPLVPGGIVTAYRQDHWASLCLHLITPILTLMDFLMIDSRDYLFRKTDALLSAAPPVAYFVFIIILHRFGMQWKGGMAAPYPFLNYAAPAGWFGFMPDTIGITSMGIGVFYVIVILLCFTLLIGWGLLKLANRHSGQKIVD